MDISDRKKKILRAVIDDYIDTAEPVGSKAIAENAGLGLSSATIRNEMAELEAMGFLEQPHTSAGRIPSSLGYRMYVNELMQRHRLSLEETEEINRNLRERVQQLDHLITDAGQIVSHLTSYPAYSLTVAAQSVTISRFDLIFIDQNTFIIVVMLSNNTVKNKLVHLPTAFEQQTLIKLATVFNANFTGISDEMITTQLINASERAAGDDIGLVAAIAGFALEALSETHTSQAFLTGTSRLLGHPEFRNVDKAQRLLNYLSDDKELLKLPVPNTDDPVKITIGDENDAEPLKDSSVVVAKYDAGENGKGLVGIVGPTRMNYSKVAARLSYIARGIGALLSGKELPPAGRDKNNGK